MNRTHPVGYGMPQQAFGYFILSQAFDIVKPEEKIKNDLNSSHQQTLVKNYIKDLASSGDLK